MVLTCPEDLGSESIKWERNGDLLPNEYGEQLFLDDFAEMENSGYYACYTSNSLEKNYLYLKARGNMGPLERTTSRGCSQLFPLTQLTGPWHLCVSLTLNLRLLGATQCQRFLKSRLNTNVGSPG